MGPGKELGKGASNLTLTDVDRRRTELWTTSLFVVAAVIIAIALYLIGQDFLPDQLQFEALSSWVALVLLAGLVLAFMIYIIEKERSLRRLSALLVEERVRSASLTDRLAQISRLSDLGRAVNATLDPQEVFDHIISFALDTLGGDQGSVLEMDEARENLVVVFYKGPSKEQIVGTKQPWAGQAIEGEGGAPRPVLAQAGDTPQTMVPDLAVQPLSSMSVPLVRQDEFLGVVNLSDTTGKKVYTQQDLEALGFFAEHAAIAIGNARAFEKERQTIERFAEIDRMKSDFVATISHELKTPLTSIIGAAKTVGRTAGRLDPETQASFIEIINRQGHRLLRLVEDVLTTSKIESGPRPMKREDLDLRDLASQIIAELSHTDIGMDRRITLRTTPESPRVWGDATAVQQILMNLTENACKYSDSDTEIVVAITEGDDEVVIEVSDQGQGISATQLGTIFDRFRQVDSSSTRAVGGVGLGLFIVKNLAEAQGGTVSVDSQPGKGSTFRVTFRQRSERAQQ